MKKEVNLPDYLFPFVTKNLIRIGSSDDGSYLVEKNSVTNSDILLSLGVGTTFEFEKSFLNLNKVPLIAFDGSAGLRSHLKKIRWRIRQIFALRNLDYFKESFFYFFIPFKFYFFFKNFRNSNLSKNYRRFVKQYVGVQESYISLNKIFNKFVNPHEFKNIFLQVDIEGGEYEILDEILELQNNISGLVIEFHDINLYMNEIEHFIKNFKLQLVHNHINNIGGLTYDNKPNVIELTFANTNSLEKVQNLPHKFDRPNSSTEFDYFAKRI